MLRCYKPITAVYMHKLVFLKLKCLCTITANQCAVKPFLFHQSNVMQYYF